MSVGANRLTTPPLYGSQLRGTLTRIHNPAFRAATAKAICRAYLMPALIRRENQKI